MSNKYNIPQAKRIDWETPPSVFDPLNREFDFTIDVCATPENTKCERFYTEEQDGLKQLWTNERVWMNPPYGRAAGLWIEKAYNSVECGSCQLVVALLKSATGNKWFHNYVWKHAEIRYIQGRIRFIGAQQFAPFDSIIVIWRKRRNANLIFDQLPFRQLE